MHTIMCTKRLLLLHLHLRGKVDLLLVRPQRRRCSGRLGRKARKLLLLRRRRQLRLRVVAATRQQGRGWHIWWMLRKRGRQHRLLHGCSAILHMLRRDLQDMCLPGSGCRLLLCWHWADWSSLPLLRHAPLLRRCCRWHVRRLLHAVLHATTDTLLPKRCMQSALLLLRRRLRSSCPPGEGGVERQGRAPDGHCWQGWHVHVLLLHGRLIRLPQRHATRLGGGQHGSKRLAGRARLRPGRLLQQLGEALLAWMGGRLHRLLWCMRRRLLRMCRRYVLLSLLPWW